jgi:cellulose synthase/poly-beta-1,6-N-acetylglucosamine synthase-like glycosyltransferase
MYILFYFTLLLLFFYGVLISYYERSWKKMPVFNFSGLDPARLAKISVVIAARNEEKNIYRCLESLKKQTYPASQFEVIIVDDHSTDRTADVVSSFSMTNLQLLTLGEYLQDGKMNAFKKKAIEAGIAHAGGELIVTTDADCEMHPNWLHSLAVFYKETGAAFIAAPVKMKGPKRLLSIFQSLDFLTMQGITAAAVYSRFHYMCNGANLAYPKSIFHEVGGFSGIDHIASGDDMLLLQKIAARYPEKIFYLRHQDAVVCTTTEPKWSAFLNQRVRWSSKAGSYTDKRLKSVLLLVYLVNLTLLIFLLAGFFRPMWLIFFFLLLIVKLLLEISFVRKVAVFFRQQDLLPYFPFLQPLHVIYIVVAGWLGFYGSYKWKERKVK